MGERQDANFKRLELDRVEKEKERRMKRARNKLGIN